MLGMEAEHLGESEHTLCRLQDKYQISAMASSDRALCHAANQRNSSNTTTATADARATFLQHLEEFKQRAAAVKASADAVQAWHSQQQGAAAAAAALPAEVLMVLNREADKGLLHMLQGRGEALTYGASLTVNAPQSNSEPRTTCLQAA
jgi:hypothetical protein